MSKSTKRALIASLVLLVCGAVIVGIAFVLGAEPEDAIRFGSFELGDYIDDDSRHTPAQSGNSKPGDYAHSGASNEPTTENDDGRFYSEFTVNAVDKMDIEISWVAGDVEILRWDRDEIKFREESGREISENDLMRCSVSGDGRKINVDYRKSDMFINIGGLLSKDLTVTLPYDVDISELGFSSTSANLRIADELSVRRFDFDSTSGDLIASLKAEGIEADTVSGDINIVGEFNEIEIDTTSGSSKLGCLTAPDEISFCSISGNLAAALPRDAGFKLEFDSVSGELDCGIPTVESGDNKIAGDGSIEIDVETVSGNLTVFAQ